MAVPYNLEKKRAYPTLKHFFRHVAIGIPLGGLLALLVRVFLYEPILIETSSMEPTLQKGGIYGVHKWIRSYQIGDIVLCKLESGSIVSRIIGKGGDSIGIHSKLVFRNGDSIPPEVYPIQHKDTRPALPAQLTRRDNREDVRVPEGHFFLLGDNRDEAMDSRILGNLPVDCIVGKFFE